MRNKLKIIRLSIFLLVVGIILLTISARGCPKRRKDKIGSSNEWAGIAAPSSLTATAFSSSEIRLSWQDNSTMPPEDGFEIERSTSSDTQYSLLVTVSANTISYSDTGLSQSTTYYYRVRALNTIGDRSEWSNIASVKTPILDQLVWAQVAAGGEHTLALTTDGRVWSWGIDNFGQLGLGDTIYNYNRLTPSLIEFDIDWGVFENVSAVSAGQNYSIALKTGGTLWSWGSNGSGQLGLGDTYGNADAPTPIGTDSDWTRVVAPAGGYHTIGIKLNQTLWAWGYNGFGQLGLGDSINRWTPTQINSAADWSIVAGGFAYTIGLKTDSTIWAWGGNEYGQLGLGDSGSPMTDRNTATQIGTDSDWSSVSAGLYSTIGIKSNNTIWAWGNNAFGQLGDGTTDNRNTPRQIGTDSDWSFVVAGNTYIIGIKSNPDGGRTLWAWGKNDYGQLGLGDSGYTTYRTTPTQIGTDSDWFSVAAGYAHTIGIKTNRTLWTWGLNNYGQLGLGDIINRNIPCLLGSPATPLSLIATPLGLSQIALTWTDNSSDETGFKIERKLNAGGFYQEIVTVDSGVTSWLDTSISQGTTYYYRVRAYNDIGNSPYSNEAWATLSGIWFKVTAASEHTIAMKLNGLPAGQAGTIWSWGWNNRGQLGLGYTSISVTTPTQIIIGTDSDWSMVAAGGDNSLGGHSIGLKTNGTLWGWGYNSYGQLGIGDSGAGKDRTTPTQIDINSDWIAATCGYTHTIARKTDGTLWAWGQNNMGQLGLADITNRSTPSYIGTDSDWSMVTAGGNHTLGRKTNGTIWAWGWNEYGQLGLGDVNRNTPSQIPSALDWSMVTAGSEYTVALKTDLTIWAWGRNNYGQLGLGNSGSSAERITPTQIIIGTDSDWSAVTTGSEHTIAIKTTGAIWAWGNNNNGQLGDGTTNRRITPRLIGSALDWSMVAGGYAHTIALKTNSTLWAWGYNIYGQLGDNTTTQRTTPRLIGSASNWSMIAAGYYHTLARKTNGILWAWGYNGYGQLGLGNTYNRNVPAQIGIDSDWSNLTAGQYHNIVRKTNGTLWAWGYNGYGQLGDGTTDDRNTPRQVGTDSDWLAVSGANLSSIARKTDKTIWGWGTNFYGELGIGNNPDRWTPSLINSESDWFVFATGGSHTLAIKTNGGIWSWGKNKYGQLGLGDKDVNTNRITPTQIGTDTDWLVPIESGSGANLSTIAAGTNYSIAIKNNLTIWAWGNNNFNQLGLGGGYDRYNPVIIGTDSDWSMVTAGGNHTLGRKTNGTLWSWGSNGSGQLGLGDSGWETNKNSPTQIGINSDWSGIAAGINHTLASRTNGTLWAWGANSSGQLGLGGDIIGRNVPTLVGE